MYINDSIPVKICYDLCDLCFECLWITLRTKWLPRSVSRIAASAYLPSNLISNDLDKVCGYFYYCYDRLFLESSDPTFIVARDFQRISTKTFNQTL